MMLKRILTAAIVALGLCGNATAQNPPPVRLGFSMAKTGLLAAGGAQQLKAYELWRDTVNAAGGLDVAGTKRPVEFVVYDDQSNSANAVKIYEKLITDDKVDLLLAPFGTPAHLAIVPLLERFRFPMVANTASSVHVRELKPGNIWFVSPSVHDRLAVELVKLAKANKVASVAVLSNQIPPATEIRRFLMPALKEGNLNVLVDEQYPADIKDMTSVLTKVRDAKPDAVFVLSLFSDSALYVRQAKEMRIQAGLQFIAIGPQYPAFTKMFGDATNGLVSLGHWSTLRTDWAKAAPFAAAFEKKWGEPPDYLDSVLAYTSCEILQQAVAKAGLDKDKIREVISTDTFDTINGPIKFKGVENVSLPVGFVQRQDGKMQIIWPASIATHSFEPKGPW
jgi:branched-chain amino acid transport system substrate-binding protein